MMDDSDSDTFWIAAMFTKGPIGWIFLALFIVVLFVVASNKEDCAKKSCPNGMTPKLMSHECLCVQRAN